MRFLSPIVFFMFLMSGSILRAQSLEWQSTAHSYPIVGSVSFTPDLPEIRAVHVGPNGTIYSSGRFNGSRMTYAGVTLYADTSNLFSNFYSQGDELWTGFIIAQNQSGTVLWTKTLSSNKATQISSASHADINMPSHMCTAPDGSLYVTGKVTGDTLYLNGAQITTGVAGFSGLSYLFKFNTGGSLVWSQYWTVNEFGAPQTFNYPVNVFTLGSKVYVHIWSDGIVYNGVNYPAIQKLDNQLISFQQDGSGFSFQTLPNLGEGYTMPLSHWSPRLKRLVRADQTNVAGIEWKPAIFVQDSLMQTQWSAILKVSCEWGEIPSFLESVTQDAEGNIYGMLYCLQASPLPEAQLWVGNSAYPIIRTTPNADGYVLIKLSAQGCLLWARTIDHVHNGGLAVLENGCIAGINTSSMTSSMNWLIMNSDTTHISTYNRSGIGISQSPLVPQIPTNIYAWNGSFFGTPYPLSHVSECMGGFIGGYGRSVFRVSYSPLPDPGVDSSGYITSSGPTQFCQGGSVTLTANGGTNYEWMPDGQTSASITVANSGLYQVKVFHGAGCYSVASVQVEVTPIPVVDAGPDASFAANSGTVSLLGIPSGGTWSGAGVSAGGDFSTALAAGTYTVRYCLAVNGCSACDEKTITITGGNEEGSVADPAIVPGSGSFSGSQLVSINSATPGATIYYTTSGNVPVPGTAFTKVYSAPFTIYETTTIRSIAVKAPLKNSRVMVSVLTTGNPGIASTPSISPAAGAYTSAQLVTLTTSTEGASIYYTLNGNNPRLDVPNSYTKLYSGPFTVGSSLQVRAIAVKTGFQNSPVTTAAYSFASAAVAAAVQFSPPPGVFGSPVSVALSSTTADAQIYYTTNGNNPRLDVPNFFTRLYSTPVVLTGSAMVRAVAVAPGFANSGITSGIYTIGGAFRKGVEVEESAMETQMQAFPNPFRESFQLSLPASEHMFYQVEVYNTLGERVLRLNQLRSGETHEIDLGEQPTGIYLVQVVGSGSRSLIRVVKE